MKQLHVEASTYCNARCPLCPRNLFGYKVEGVYPEIHLSVKNFKKALARFPERELVYFNGNLGDPMMNPNIVELVKCANCSTAITTNGSIGSKQTWQQLARENVEVRFSIDGLEDTNHLYRQDVQWSKLMDRVTWFIEAGGKAIWKWIVFKHNAHQEDKTRDLAKKLGFFRFDKSDQGRNYGPALDKEGKVTHWILPADGSKRPDGFSLHDGIKRYKESHDNFPLENKTYDIDCLHLRDKDSYINAKGEVSPCCFHGYDMPGRPLIPLEDLPKLMATWKTNQCNSICAITCGTKWRD